MIGRTAQVSRLPAIADQHIIQFATSILSVETRRRTVIALLASEAGEGTSTVAVNVAQALEQMLDRRVAIVDANYRAPALHTHYGVPRTPGLLDLIRGDATIREAVHVAEPGLLGVLPIGTARNDNATLLLRQNGLSQILDILSHNDFGTILLDCPPVLGVPEAAVLAAQADSTFLIIRAEWTKWPTASGAVERLEAAGATVRGAVLNQISPPLPGFLARRLGQ